MTCPFCSIVRGELPASIVLRDEQVCAFLDARPLFKGHVLVVPVAHVPMLSALEASAIAPLFSAVQRVVRAIKQGLGAQGCFVATNEVVSQSVPHLHVHVVPRTKGDGLRGFFWPRLQYRDDAERDQYAARIVAALDAA